MTDAGPVTGERYVALGDSYTIGEGVEPGHAWPNLLTNHLQQDEVAIELVANPSVTGWTTRQVIEHELPIFEDSCPTLATLLIGVNDWVQGTSPEEFGRRLAQIIDRVQATLPDRRKVILITIPDFSRAPVGSQYANGRDIAQGIANFNDVVEAEAGLRSLPVVDIYPLSQRLEGPEFFATDDLHPSALAYERWEQLIYPAAMSLLG